MKYPDSVVFRDARAENDVIFLITAPANLAAFCRSSRRSIDGTELILNFNISKLIEIGLIEETGEQII